MTGSRSGHHGDIGYVFEDAGFDTEPNDTTIKTLGSDAMLDDFGADYQAVRKYNADRFAAEVIRQNFDGAWGASFNLSEPPWWLAAVFGQPTSTLVSGSLYDYEYDLSNGNDPTSLRFYLPTDGFANYKVIPGAWIVSVSVDQSNDGSADVSIAGGYAREPFTDDTVSVSIPNFSESTYVNRHAELQLGGTTVGKAQNTSLTIETGTEGVPEIGSENAVDFRPGAFTPDVTWDKILSTTQTVDPLDEFSTGAQVNNNLIYDNGKSGDDTYSVDWQVTDALPGSWSESGRNDPEAALTEELQNMGEVATVTVTTSEGAGDPPGITL